MLRHSLGIAMFALLLGCSSEAPDQPDDGEPAATLVPIRDADSDTTDQELVALANSDFAFDLYARLRHGDGNFVFSPYNISNGLAMCLAGARGKTEEEIAKCMRLSIRQDRVHSAFHDLNQSLRRTLEAQGVTLNIADRLWADQALHIDETFRGLTRDQYEAELATVDFTGHRGEACRQINDWIKEQTKGKLHDLVSANNLPADTLMALICAIYFKANWAQPFWKEYTKQAPFHVSRRETVDVPMMHLDDISEAFRMVITPELQMLELRYNVPPHAGGDFCMLILLPKQNDGLAALERNLTIDRLAEWISGLERGHYQVLMPRFQMTSDLDLKSPLSEMGIPTAFQRGLADFSGIGEGDFYLSEGMHAAFISVDEEGTEAAAATKYLVGALDDSKPNVFRADHPGMWFLLAKN
jgi:serpin B